MKTKPLTFLLALTFLFLFSGSVFGGDYDDGFDAYKRKDYEKAYKLFLSAGKDGGSCCGAQYMLGLMYEEGQGISQDHKEAVKWYRLAAEQDTSEAQFKLGKKYHEGRGVPQNYEVAVKWYQLAAEWGHKNAKLNLLQLAKKSPDALKLLITSAENGNPKSQYHLGLIYLEVTGLQDYVLAHKWFNLANSQGHGYAEKNKNFAENKMTPQQIEKAQEMAKNWKPTGKLIILLRKFWKQWKHYTGLHYLMIKLI
jgi:TPR repeat protein